MDALEERANGRFNAALIALVVALLGIILFQAASADVSSRSVDTPHSAFVEATIEAGRTISHFGGVWMDTLRVPLLCLVMAGALVLIRRGTTKGLLAIAVPLSLAWIAQSFVLVDSIGIGVAVYSAAAASYVLWRRSAPQPEPSSGRTVELFALALPIALFAGIATYHLDVYPRPHYDEASYRKAARMQVGQIERGWVVGPNAKTSPTRRHSRWALYTFDQFQLQFVPLMFHVAAEKLFGFTPLSTRLASVFAMSLALLVAGITLHNRAGPDVAAASLWLAAAAPLGLAVSRPGFYISVTILHGALVFHALLRLGERWNLRWAAWLGVLLGGSLYFYQLSWFLPIFAVIWFALSPELWRRPGRTSIAITVAAAAIVALAPGVLELRAGIRKVASQTFDRVVNLGPQKAGRASALIRPPFLVDANQVRDYAKALDSLPGLHAVALPGGDGPQRILMSGNPVRTKATVTRAMADDWVIVNYNAPSRSAWVRLQRMFSDLTFRQAGDSGLEKRPPLLNPMILGPLLIGVVHALHRRRDPLYRALLIWVIAGALLPSIAGGEARRRAVLILPYLYALAALPLVELLQAARAASPPVRSVVGVVSVLFVASVICVDLYAYFLQVWW